MVRISSSTTAFAMMSRRTHGVKRLEGARFMEPPLTLRPLNAYDGSLQAAQLGGSTDPFAQVGELYADRPGGLGEKARGRHPGQRIHF